MLKSPTVQSTKILDKINLTEVEKPTPLQLQVVQPLSKDRIHITAKITENEQQKFYGDYRQYFSF